MEIPNFDHVNAESIVKLTIQDVDVMLRGKTKSEMIEMQLREGETIDVRGEVSIFKGHAKLN